MRILAAQSVATTKLPMRTLTPPILSLQDSIHPIITTPQRQSHSLPPPHHAPILTQPASRTLLLSAYNAGRAGANFEDHPDYGGDEGRRRARAGSRTPFGGVRSGHVGASQIGAGGRGGGVEGAAEGTTLL